MIYEKLSALQEALKNRGVLTKTQLRYTQRVYNLNNKTLADLFKIKLNSFNALKSYSTGSGNYNNHNMQTISEYIKNFRLDDFQDELDQHGMIVTYSSKSWDGRIRSAKQFDSMEDFDAQLCRWLAQDDKLLVTNPLIVSTKELSNIMYLPEKDVTKALDAESADTEVQADLFNEFN